MDKTGKYLTAFEVSVGLLALIVSIFYLAPIRLVDFGTMIAQYAIMALPIFGILLIAVAAVQLAKAFLAKNTELPKKTVLATSLLTIIPMIILLVLFLDLSKTPYFADINRDRPFFGWIHYLLGISIASYAVSQIIVGLTSKGLKLSVRVISAMFGIYVGLLSILILYLHEVYQDSLFIIANGIRASYSPLPYFSILTEIAIMVIGIELLLTSAINMQRQKPTIQTDGADQPKIDSNTTPPASI